MYRYLDNNENALKGIKKKKKQVCRSDSNCKSPVDDFYSRSSELKKKKEDKNSGGGRGQRKKKKYAFSKTKFQECREALGSKMMCVSLTQFPFTQTPAKSFLVIRDLKNLRTEVRWLCGLRP